MASKTAETDCFSVRVDAILPQSKGAPRGSERVMKSDAVRHLNGEISGRVRVQFRGDFRGWYELLKTVQSGGDYSLVCRHEEGSGADQKEKATHIGWPYLFKKYFKKRDRGTVCSP